MAGWFSGGGNNICPRDLCRCGEWFLLSQGWRPEHDCHSVDRAGDARCPVRHEALYR